MTRKSILIVDDEPSVGRGLRPILESRQVEVVTALSAREAEELLDARTFDLVITDLNLRGRRDRDGLDLITRIRDAAPDSKVVLFTAYGTAAVRDEALHRGARDTWEKSMPIRELIDRVRGLGIPVAAARK
jgi:DNA-binding NtrC family response regulator